VPETARQEEPAWAAILQEQPLAGPAAKPQEPVRRPAAARALRPAWDRTAASRAPGPARARAEVSALEPAQVAAPARRAEGLRTKRGMQAEEMGTHPAAASRNKSVYLVNRLDPPPPSRVQNSTTFGDVSEPFPTSGVEHERDHPEESALNPAETRLGIQVLIPARLRASRRLHRSLCTG
jgi:hypothetical protein